MKEEFISLPLQLEVPQSEGEFKLGMMFRESLEQDRGMLFIFENTDYHSFHMKNTFIPLDIAFINEEGVIESIKELDPMNPIPVYPDGEIRYAVEVNRGWFAENGVEVGDILLEDTEETEIDLNEVKDKKGKGSGTKDACYHKVKSRYSVWPSAYASGALVKCRKVGAANWGNSSKKEEVEYEYEVPTKAHYNWRETLDEGMAGALVKGGSKLIPALMTGIGAAGTMMQIKKKNIDPMDFGKSKRSEEEKDYARNRRKSAGLGKKKINVQGRNQKMQGGFSKGIKNEKEVKDTKEKTTSSKGFGEEYYDWRSTLDEKCWKGYEKKGMKTMFGKRYPNCVKKTKKEELEVEASSLDEKKKYNPDAKNDSAFDNAGDKLLGIIKPKKIDKKVKKIDEKLVHGDFGNFIKGQKLDKRKEKKYKEPPYKDLAASVDLEGDVVSEKKMTKKQMKKRDEIADAISTKDMKDRYGDKNVKYAIATKLAMKEDITDEALTIQDWNVDDIKFTEIETVDIIKPTPLKENKAKLAIQTAKMTGKLFKAMGRKMQSGKVNPLTGNVFAKSGAVKFSRTFAPMDVGGGARVKSQRQLNTFIQGAKENIRTGKGIPAPVKTKFKDTKKGTEIFADKRGINTYPPSPTGEKLKKIRLSTPVKKLRAADKQMDRYTMGLYKPALAYSGVDAAVKGTTGRHAHEVIGDKILEPGRKKERERIKKDLDDLYNKIQRDAKEKNMKKEEFSDWRNDLGEDWQKVNRKDKTDGMSKKAVKAYRRENPGSKLKTAVTKDPKKLKKGSKSAKRRLSFCRRMKGMKKKLTSAKTSRDPDSRINKALRRWNC